MSESMNTVYSLFDCQCFHLKVIINRTKLQLLNSIGFKLSENSITRSINRAYLYNTITVCSLMYTLWSLIASLFQKYTSVSELSWTGTIWHLCGSGTTYSIKPYKSKKSDIKSMLEINLVQPPLDEKFRPPSIISKFVRRISWHPQN